MTKKQLSDAGRRAGASAVQALVMVAMFRLADAAFDAASEWVRSRRAARTAE